MLAAASPSGADADEKLRELFQSEFARLKEWLDGRLRHQEKLLTSLTVEDSQRPSRSSSHQPSTRARDCGDAAESAAPSESLPPASQDPLRSAGFQLPGCPMNISISPDVALPLTLTNPSATDFQPPGTSGVTEVVGDDTAQAPDESKVHTPEAWEALENKVPPELTNEVQDVCPSEWSDVEVEDEDSDAGMSSMNTRTGFMENKQANGTRASRSSDRFEIGCFSKDPASFRGGKSFRRINGVGDDEDNSPRGSTLSAGKLPPILESWFKRSVPANTMKDKARFMATRSAGAELPGQTSDPKKHTRKGFTPALDGIWHDVFRASGEHTIDKDAQAEVARHSQFIRRSIQHQGLLQLPGTSWFERTCRQIGDYVHEKAPILTTPMNPYCTQKVSWDLIGVVFVCYDILMIPLNVAWERETKDGPEVFLWHLSIVYWTLDILMTFNTGVIKMGKLQLSRRYIVERYAKSWLPFDLVVVALDYWVLLIPANVMMSMFRALRSARVLRALRIVRILKLRKFTQIIEDLCFRHDQGWLALAATIFKTLLTVILAAHVGACIWYGVGKTNLDSGNPSWLSFLYREHGPGAASELGETYSMALHYVLAHLTAAPVDGKMNTENVYERFVAMAFIVTSLLILGTAISKISQTMHELNKMESELADTKREMRRYFKAMSTPIELSCRILHFVEESQKRTYTLALSPKMINVLSEPLALEVILNARSRYIISHPLFHLLSQYFKPVFVATCTAFEGTVYANNDVVFQADTWAAGLYVMAQGMYYLKCRDEDSRTFDKPGWFSEVSLFARTLHQSTLVSIHFSDAYCLSGRNFAHCVKKSPGCTQFLIRYAQAYLGGLWDGDETNCPSDKLLVHDELPYSLAQAACESAVEKEDVVDEVVYPPTGSRQETMELVAGICAGTFDDSYITSKLPTVFGELHPVEGLYVQADECLEQKRVTCALLSVHWLLGNRYESFVASQSQEKLMSPQLWGEWQEFIRFADLSEEDVCVLLVFLCVRGLGKSKSLAKMLGFSEWSSPSTVLHELLERDFITSVQHFSPKMHDLLVSIIKIFNTFNFPQFLQAENVPYHILALDLAIEQEGEKPFRCYLVAIFAMMCGLGAARTMKGSTFMDADNGRTVMLGIKCLKMIGTTSPQMIYWNYVTLRAQHLDFALTTPEDHVVARIACLTRASVFDLDVLQDAWGTLSYAEQDILTAAFLADGLHVRADVYQFLPLFFERAKNNACVGLPLALETLVGLASVLTRELRAKQATFAAVSVVEINLSDLAAFAGEVKCSQVFRQVPQNCIFTIYGKDVHVMVKGDLWSQVRHASQIRDQDNDMQEVTYLLTKLERETAAIQRHVAGFKKHKAGKSVEDSKEVKTRSSKLRRASGCR